MTDQKNMTIWKQRYQALHSAIEQFQDSLLREVNVSTKEQLEKLDAPSPEQKEALNLFYLVECLKKFAYYQFEFFHDGFLGSGLDENGQPVHEKYLLNWSKEFPPEHVFGTTLNQIAEDLEVMRRIADQRLEATTGAQLRQADRLVSSALEPVYPGKLPTVMTYFQKSPSIRVIPYAEVALIGIPFMATGVPRDYLAIPHEVGHYVYRHCKVRVSETGEFVEGAGGELKPIPQVLGRKLLELPEPSPKYVQRWKEEIFADVYGCLVGGPVVALSFRDLALQSTRTQIVQIPGEYQYGQLTEDDGVHPTAILRPYVYARVLEKMGLRAVQEFEDAWTKRIGQITEVSPAIHDGEVMPEIKATINNQPHEKVKSEIEAAKKAREQIRKGTRFRSRYTGAGSAIFINVEEAKRDMDKVIDKVIDIIIALLPDSNRDVWFKWPNNAATEQFNILPNIKEGVISTLPREVLGDLSFTLEELSFTINASVSSERPGEVVPASPSPEASQSLEEFLYNIFEIRLYHDFNTSIISELETVVPDHPSLQPPSEDLWKNWVKDENFFPGLNKPPTLIAIDPGKADRLEALEQEPRYTWNHVFWAGGWNTKANGTGSNGILLPRNWRGQSDGGSSGY